MNKQPGQTVTRARGCEAPHSTLNIVLCPPLIFVMCPLYFLLIMVPWCHAIVCDAAHESIDWAMGDLLSSTNILWAKYKYAIFMFVCVQPPESGPEERKLLGQEWEETTSLSMIFCQTVNCAATYLHKAQIISPLRLASPRRACSAKWSRARGRS